MVDYKIIIMYSRKNNYILWGNYKITNRSDMLAYMACIEHLNNYQNEIC